MKSSKSTRELLRQHANLRQMIALGGVIDLRKFHDIERLLVMRGVSVEKEKRKAEVRK